MTTPTAVDGIQQVRTVGSNYTTFMYAGQAIAYLEIVEDSGQAARGGSGGAGFEAIHPLGSTVPTDIVTSRILGYGTLTLTIRELWHQEIWQQLSGLAGATNIVDIFRLLATTSQYVTCTKIVTPPNGPRYGRVYHRCVIIAIEDGETLTIGTLSVAKTITIAYTHSLPL